MSIDKKELAMVVTTYMLNVEESSIDNTHHNHKHNPQQTDKDGTNNNFEKVAPKYCGF